ncbi:MAG: uracil-DNA glycosylase [Acetobacteraceae bacterium]|nr:uracil-DNA glycosylase [Acetobacteraceae bacterium]
MSALAGDSRQQAFEFFALEAEASVPGATAGDSPPLDLAGLAARAAECARCGLRSGCRGVVFGEGPADARLMLVGEGPGAAEDELGRPFVGPAGQLLDRILAAAGLPRERVYITNVVKCRPPQNRLPTPVEVEACRPWLLQQIGLVRPVVLVCLGALACQALLDPGARITRIRGLWQERDGMLVMPTYHPAAVLRDPNKKRPVWEDFKKVRAAYLELVEGVDPESLDPGSSLPPEAPP